MEPIQCEGRAFPEEVLEVDGYEMDGQEVLTEVYHECDRDEGV